MGLIGVSRNLLVFISVVSLTRAQSTVSAATTTTTTTTTTAFPTTTTARTSTAVSGTQWPAIFYPFGSAVGDVQTLVATNDSYAAVNLSSPFVFFGRTYNIIYVNNNGLLSFNQPIPEANPYIFPTYGSEDLIAALWTELDDYGLGAYYYQEYTSGNVLTQATEDIKRYYPGLSFNATWVFVATWDYVATGDSNTFLQHSAPSISFQAVLISDGVSSFILMNYGDMSVIGYQVEAGYDTVGSTHYFVIPGSNDPNLIPNLKSSSNVNTPGRWAFSANQGIVQFSEIFYPVGLAFGDVQTLVMNVYDDSYASVNLASPFVYFGRTYNIIYVNNNGLLSFNQPIPEANPYIFPTYGSEDLIAALWTELDDYGLGAYYYHEYTSGNVLTRATEDIKRYYPGLSFNANWVFVATWDYVATGDQNTFLRHSAPSISFQAVLISDGVSSFILMNYGDISVIGYQVESGYDTVGSTHYFVIPDSNDGNLIPNLKSTSNVNTPGRWAFSANQGIVQFSEIFYPVGLVVGDVQTLTTSDVDESYALVNLASPFVYFGRTYNLIYVNYYGVLSFFQSIPEGISYNIPTYGGWDLIAPLWADLDDYGLGAYYYHEYTSGNVLTRATEDIKRYYPGLSFNATWVFVATWDYVYTWDQNTFLLHSAPSISFQVVLISDDVSSFILMNYGDISVAVSPVVSGYDTVGSINYFVIPGSNNPNLISNLKSSSNVNAPGRWAFYANQSIVQFSEIFYPVGLAAGDAQTVVVGTDDYVPVNLASPFLYFGRPYSLIYVNNNGLLSFSQPIPEAHPFIFPAYGSQDLIAALWTELDDYGYGEFYYQEYTSGNVLTRATEDIKRYYSGLSFNATWVFVATWDYVQTWDLNTFLQHSAPSISFQAVLISDGVFSFILMNYGDMSTIVYPTEAGYDTVGSTDYYVIPLSNDPNLIPNLKLTSNVNTQGRWAFSVNQENVVGLQMQVTSLLDLTDSGNLAFVMKKLKDELVNRGMPSNVGVTARKVQKTP